MIFASTPLKFATALLSCFIALFWIMVPDAQADHWPSSCGAKGQKPCKIWQHVPSCRPNLVEKLGRECVVKRALPPLIPRPNNCGAEGQKPCPLPHIPSCNGKLVEHFVRGKCIRSDGDIVNLAKNLIRESGHILEAAAQALATCGLDALMQQRYPFRPQVAQQIQNSHCFAQIKHNARQLGYNTITIGASGGVALLIGAEGENGFAFDVNGRNPVATYHTLGLKLGTIGAGTAVTVGFFKKDNLSFGGDAHGAVVGFSAVGGSGAGAWFEYNGDVAGINASITAGAEAEIGYVRNTTQVVALSSTGSYGQTSGGDNYTDQGEEYGPDNGTGYKGGESARPGATQGSSEPAQTDFERSQQAAVELGTQIGLAIRQRREMLARKTQLRFCNKSKNKIVNVAYAYWKEASIGGEDGWFLTGWFQVKRNRCKDKLYLPDGPDGNGQNYRVQIVGLSYTDKQKTKMLSFEGEGVPLCVNTDRALNYGNASRKLCAGPKSRFLRGIEFETSPGRNTFTFNY